MIAYGALVHVEHAVRGVGREEVEDGRRERARLVVCHIVERVNARREKGEHVPANGDGMSSGWRCVSA